MKPLILSLLLTSCVAAYVPGADKVSPAIVTDKVYFIKGEALPPGVCVFDATYLRQRWHYVWQERCDCLSVGDTVFIVENGNVMYVKYQIKN